MNIFEELPTEIVSLIFGNLTVIDIWALRQISRGVKKQVENGVLYPFLEEKFCENYGRKCFENEMYIKLINKDGPIKDYGKIWIKKKHIEYYAEKYDNAVCIFILCLSDERWREHIRTELEEVSVNSLKNRGYTEREIIFLVHLLKSPDFFRKYVPSNIFSF